MTNAAAYLVDRHVKEGRGDRVAVRHEGSDTTYAELLAATAKAGGAWQALGVRREERVMFCMPDTPQLLAGILGAFRIGAVAVPVSTMFTGRELGGVLADSGARVLVVGGELADVATEAAGYAPELRHLVVLNHGAPGDATPAAEGRVDVTGWETLVDAAEESELVDASDDAQALWLYTSGTTGRPKAAMHRHANVRHVCETYGSQVLGIRPDDRCLSVAKLFFAYGLGNGAFFPLSVGATTILEPRRSTPQVVAERIRADAPTLFFGVPTFFAAMLAADLPADLLTGVRLATSAGEALPATLMRRWTDRFGVDILDGLGSTEALHIFLSNAPGDIGPGTSGRAVPGYEVEVRAEDGTPAPSGVPGSLFVRGESIALGYWCRTVTTRQVFGGEWLATGDTYVLGDDGRYTCLGRSNDMIKAGGMWVSPGEVEARLLEHDDVVEAAVIGVPDDAGLDKPVAYVVLRPGAGVTSAELVEHCRAAMAHFKAPRSVETVEALPRTATGKLQRFRVRELAAESRSSPVSP